jgi:hypothetical protein
MIDKWSRWCKNPNLANFSLMPNPRGVFELQLFEEAIGSPEWEKAMVAEQNIDKKQTWELA